MISRPAPDPAPLERPVVAAWTAFWFGPSRLTSLRVLRVLFGLTALLWLLPLAGHVEAFFGLTGWYDAVAVTEAAALPQSLYSQLAWSPLYEIGHNPTALHAAYWGGIVILGLFTLGLFTRLTAVLAWLVVVTFTTNPLLETEADVLLRLLAFYLMIGYLLTGLFDSRRPLVNRLLAPFDHWVAGPTSTAPSVAATVALRLIQVHVALAVFSMALHKLQFAEWWGGISFWYPLTTPSEMDIDTINRWAAHPLGYLSLLSLAAYGTLAWQLAFPFFAWRRGRARWVLVGGAVCGAIGLATVYRLPLLGVVFLVLCLAYIRSDEWDRLLTSVRARTQEDRT